MLITPIQLVAIDTGSCKIGLQFHFSVFDLQAFGWDSFQPTLQWHQQADHAALRLTLYSRPKPAAFHWKDVQDAGVAFTCWFSDASVSLSEFDGQYKEVRIRSAPEGEQVHHRSVFRLAGRERELSLKVRRKVGTFAQMEQAYAGQIDRQPVPIVRLSELRIAT